MFFTLLLLAGLVRFQSRCQREFKIKSEAKEWIYLIRKTTEQYSQSAKNIAIYSGGYGTGQSRL
jgi:hypothetical protein